MSLIRLPRVMALTGLSRTSIHRLEANGRFPRRRRIGQRAVAWDADEIEHWIGARERVTLSCAGACQPSPTSDAQR